jgi:hypothetical protein
MDTSTYPPWSKVVLVFEKLPKDFLQPISETLPPPSGIQCQVIARITTSGWATSEMGWSQPKKQQKVAANSLESVGQNGSCVGREELLGPHVEWLEEPESSKRQLAARRVVRLPPSEWPMVEPPWGAVRLPLSRSCTPGTAGHQL